VNQISSPSDDHANPLALCQRGREIARRSAAFDDGYRARIVRGIAMKDERQPITSG